ncbi:hypothetical protein TKK_0000727 [Trichogramma kaykai]|uniref:C2H2-type domain-containing protein n=1 Tax=Trichogramma kaykai TaxID=54128 RepID=A0ABD2WPA0_9HYME
MKMSRLKLITTPIDSDYHSIQENMPYLQTIKEERDDMETFSISDFIEPKSEVDEIHQTSITEDNESYDQSLEESPTKSYQKEHSNYLTDPFLYVKQYCAKCNKIYSIHKDKATKVCLKCASKAVYECIICKRRYPTKSHVFSHLKTRFDCRTMIDLHCSHCSYTSIHKGFLKNHLLKKHTCGINELISCPNCGRHFKRSTNVEEHILSCGKKPYLECNFCNFKTSYRISLKVHMNHHILEADNGSAILNENLDEIVVDAVEEMEFLWKPGDSAQKIESKMINSENKKKNYIDLNCRNIIKTYCYKCKKTSPIRTKKLKNCPDCQENLLHECGICSSKFNTSTNIIRHIRDKHGDTDIKNTYICGNCDKTYDEYKKSVRHENICKRAYPCNLCAFVAKNPSKLSSHRSRWHFGPEKDSHHPCPSCGRQMRFFNSRDLDAQCGHCR